MKNVNVVILCFLLCLSALAVAQIPGSVSFEKKQVAVQSIEENKTAESKSKLTSGIDANALLAQKIKKQRIWDNPRFSKKIYGSLKGMQESIEKVQNEELEKNKYSSEDEKKKALDEIQSQAIIHFDDFEEKPEKIHQKLNENPRDAILDMTERLTYIDKDKMTSERSEHIKQELQENFLQDYGVTMEEYKEASLKQVDEGLKQRKEESKSDTFPPLSVNVPLNVEKIDEQNALLHLSVKSPVSKNKK